MKSPTVLSGLVNDGAVKQVLQLAEGLPQGKPLAKPTVVEDGQGVAGDQLLALHGASVGKDFEGDVGAVGGLVEPLHPLRDGALLVALPTKLEEAHLFAPPVAGLVCLDQLGLGFHPGPGRQQREHRATIATRWKLLRREIQPHLRLGRLVVEEHAASNREGRSFIIQPLARKAVGKFGRVRRYVLQQQALAIAMQHILMAFGHLQGLLEVGPVPLLLEGALVQIAKK